MRFLLVLAFAIGTFAAPFDVRAHYAKTEVQIPMRDGTLLFAAIYSPRDSSHTYPILMTRTPYGAGPYGTLQYPGVIGPSSTFDEDGFIYVIEDVRGRNRSQGTWVEMRPLGGPVDESTDTYDTIEWLLHHVANNKGTVGLYGISYPGFYTLAGMVNAHPALVAASPQAPIADLYMGDDGYHNGALFLLGNFTFYQDFAGKEFRFPDEDSYRYLLHVGDVANTKKAFDPESPYWNDLIDHTTDDSFWKARDILPHLRDIKPATLIVGGWFDAEDLSGTLHSYEAIRAQSPETPVTLVMGPWPHGGWQITKGEKLGDVSFGSETSAFFQNSIELPFFRHYLKGAPDPNLPAVYVFETGANQWHRETHWPASSDHLRFYLREKHQLQLKAPVASDASDQYTSDPAHPVPFTAHPVGDVPRKYMDADQRFAGKRHDVLSYETEPLAADINIAGPMQPCIWFKTTATDLDLMIKLIDVGPNGYEELIRGEPFRAKFRHGFVKPEPLTPHAMENLQFAMPDIFHCFRKGHRLMVQIQSSWFPLVDRNPQTFTDIPNAPKQDFRKAKVQIVRSAANASYIELPVYSTP